MKDVKQIARHHSQTIDIRSKATMKLTVNLEKNSYPIYIEKHILAACAELIFKEVLSWKKIMIVSDDNVYPIYGDAL